jgi:hypothetical protein
VRLTLDALERHARPGVRTGELDRVAAGVFAAHGARSAPSLVYGFPGTVLISVNVRGRSRRVRGSVFFWAASGAVDANRQAININESAEFIVGPSHHHAKAARRPAHDG